MKYIPASVLLLLLTGSSFASVVTLDLTVNGGTSPVTIQLGDTVEVKLYATVTDNAYNSVDLGLAGYAANIVTAGGVLAPVAGYHYNPIANTWYWDNEWDVAWAVTEFATRARGNIVGDDVLGHGDGLTSFGSASSQIAVTRTLLATGCFQGVAPGTTDLAFGGTGLAANVIWYTPNPAPGGTFYSVAADTIVALGGAQVTVVPEPASLALLTLGMAPLLLRMRRPRRGS